MAIKHKFEITRRRFVAGAAAVATATAVAPLLDGCSSNSSADQELLESVKAAFPDAKVEYLDVDDSQIQPHVEMMPLDDTDYLYESSSFTLPLGALLYQSSDTRALAICPGVSSKALTSIGVVDLEAGRLTPVLGQALGANEDFVIYDARASQDAVVWVECNMVHGMWRVYSATTVDGNLTEAIMHGGKLLEEGNIDYSPPQLAIAGKKIYWTVMPDPNGPASSEDSYLRAVEYKTRDNKLSPVQTVYTSHGRMITNPTVSGDLLTIVPRVDTDAVYYQMTTLEIATDKVKNIAILPPSLRVANAVWINNGFAFGIEGNYDYAKGLALFGTYAQLQNGDYLYVNKAPVSAPVFMNNLTFVKSTKNVLGINAEGKDVVIVGTPQDCVDYGDILAGAGEQNRLVLYTTVISKIGQATGKCLVRVLDHH